MVESERYIIPRSSMRHTLAEDPMIPVSTNHTVGGTAVYIIGVVASFWLPEPTQAELPD